MSARKLHYQVALWSAFFITISAVTGLLWAYAPYIYWQGGYKEKKRDLYNDSLSGEILSPSEIITKYESKHGPIKEILLTNRFGRPVYQLALKNKIKFLADAESGVELSPLSKENAVAAASGYVASGEAVTSSLVTGWTNRTGVKFESAWVVSFNDPGSTEIVLDAATGEILEDSDKVRRFHFWIMKLHQFNYFGTRKVLTAISGVPLLILIFSGAVLGIRRLVRSRRNAT